MFLGPAAYRAPLLVQAASLAALALHALTLADTHAHFLLHWMHMARNARQRREQSGLATG